MTAVLLSVRSVARHIGDASLLGVMQTKTLLGRDGAALNGRVYEALPSVVQAGLCKRPQWLDTLMQRQWFQIGTTFDLLAHTIAR